MGCFCRLALFVFGVISFSWPALSEPAPLEVYGRNPTYDNFHISPDGTRIAFMHNHDGKIDLVIRNLSGGPAARVDASKLKVRHIKWSGPNHVLLYATRTTRVQYETSTRYETGRVFSINVTNGKAVQLLEGTRGLEKQSSLSDIRTSLWQQNGAVLMAAYSGNSDHSYYDLYKVDGESGIGERLYSGGKYADDWIVTPDGSVIARTDFHLVDDRYPERDRKFEILAWNDTDPKGSKWREIYSESVPLTPSLAVMGLNQSKQALVISSRLDGDRKGLHLMSLNDGKIVKGLFENPTIDIESALVDPYTGTIVGAHYTLDHDEQDFFDPGLKSVLSAVGKALPGQRVTVASWDKTYQKYIIFAEGSGNAGSYFLFDAPAGKLGQIGIKYEGLKPEQVASVEAFTVTARDGQKIPAYLTLPPGAARKNLPLIAMPHGGPSGRDDTSFDWWAQFMASRGYAVLKMNFRGSSGYGSAYEEAGHKQWGGLMQDDVTDAVKDVIAKGIADPTRICIVGGSYGGYAALAGAAFTPDLYRCAVSYAGLSDLPQKLRWNRDRYGDNSTPFKFWTKTMGDLTKDAAMLDKMSPAFHADDVKAAVLLVHGKDDTVVPYNQSEYMFRALKKAGKKVEYQELKGEDHYLSTEATRIEFLRILDAFLAENLPVH